MIVMNRFYSLTAAALLVFTVPVVQAQDVFFDYANLEEGAEVAKEADKFMLVYFFDPSSDSANVYDHIWRDPMVNRFVDKLAVPVSISMDSEAGQAFKARKKRGRRKAQDRAPGIYFLSETGRTLGVLRGALEGEEGIGQMMLMLGAAEYARHEDTNNMRRRPHRVRYW